MGFWNDWYQFIKENARKNMKRFSISIGAFVLLIISSIGFGFETWIVVVYAGFIETSGIIIMSLFGKNGNGSEYNSLNAETEKEVASS